MCELVCEAMKVQDMIQRGKSRVNVSALALEDDGVQELAASFTLLRSCPLDPREPYSLPCCFPAHVWSLPAGDSNKVPPFGTGRSPSAWKGSSMLWRGLLGGGWIATVTSVFTWPEVLVIRACFHKDSNPRVEGATLVQFGVSWLPAAWLGELIQRGQPLPGSLARPCGSCAEQLEKITRLMGCRLTS